MKVCVIAAIVVSSVVGAAAHAHESTRLAPQLRRAMELRHLDAFAAPLDSQSAFVAASLSPNGDLLVVRANYEPPDFIAGFIAAGRYSDVVVELLATSVKNTRVFVEDSKGDGLRAVPDGSAEPDSVFERTVYPATPQTTVFDGRKDRRSRHGKNYDVAFRETEAEYAHALKVLLRTLERIPATK